MQRAKGRGKNNFQYYSESLNSLVASRFDIEQRLSHALPKKVKLHVSCGPVGRRLGQLSFGDRGLVALAPFKLTQLGADAQPADLYFSLPLIYREHLPLHSQRAHPDHITYLNRSL